MDVNEEADRFCEHLLLAQARRRSSEEVAQPLASRFKALADPSRVAIVNRLAGAEEVCVCDFIGSLGLAQPTVSHHLKVLREAGLVEVARKRGTWVDYRLVPEAVGELAFALGGSPQPERRRRERRLPLTRTSSASGTRAGRRWRRRSTSGWAARRARPGSHPEHEVTSARSSR